MVWFNLAWTSTWLIKWRCHSFEVSFISFSHASPMRFSHHHHLAAFGNQQTGSWNDDVITDPASCHFSKRAPLGFLNGKADVFLLSSRSNMVNLMKKEMKQKQMEIHFFSWSNHGETLWNQAFFTEPSCKRESEVFVYNHATLNRKSWYRIWIIISKSENFFFFFFWN